MENTQTIMKTILKTILPDLPTVGLYISAIIQIGAVALLAHGGVR